MWVALPASALVLPPDGVELTQVHVQFEWPAVASVDQYQLQVVVDDGSGDPFAGATPVADVTLGATTPRTVVTTGLAFDTDYAWRVRGIDMGAPVSWGPTYRFTTAALPAGLPGFTITTGSGTPEPGLTLFNLRSVSGQISGGIAVAVDLSGSPIWFHETALARLADLRQLPNGRMLFTAQDRAWEIAQNGRLTWVSPDHPDLRVHHEVFPMPNGNVMVVVFEFQDVIRDGMLQRWKGDRFVEIERATGLEAWQWNTFDHLSTLDFDDTTMLLPSFPGGVPDGSYAWTHSNAVVYNAADDSVYASLRHLSRILRIDYTTQALVYQMGLGPPSMPSGDVDFGDNLFTFQHAPEPQPNGNLLVYDNGNRRDHMDQTDSTGVTKVVELAFTGTPPTDASIAWEWTLPDYASFVGDADRLPGGNTLAVSGPNGKIHEVDASGTEVWRLELPSAFPDWLVYRAERIPSLVIDVPGDPDGDGLATFVDNCPDHDNAGQADNDGDGLGDPCDLDDDADRALDAVETNTGTFVSALDTGSDPLLADTDGDGLLDGDEVIDHGSDPNLTDTDGDTLSDFDEVTTHGTDPALSDTDLDGLSDGDEINVHSTDPLDADSDDDLLSDGDEVNTYATDPLKRDSDGDAFTDGQEVLIFGTDPNDPDSKPFSVPSGSAAGAALLVLLLLGSALPALRVRA